MTEIIRAKWLMDEAATLPEAADKLRARAGELDRMHAEGWRLEGPVEDDYGTVLAPGEETGDEDETGLFDEAEAAAMLEAEGGQA